MSLKLADFSDLASKYDKFRPGYSESVLTAILSLLDKPVGECDVADVGAGTGIWSRMIANRNCRHVMAIEPNDEMRKYGSSHSEANVEWLKGSGEDTGLESESRDLISMASSFHWVDFDTATKEFHRVLRRNGLFVALWNTRYLENNILLQEIEGEILNIKPDLKRVSSGSSGITATLTEDLFDSPYFTDVIYLEGRHTVDMTVDQYVGVWESVNDVRVQLGEDKFKYFISFIREKTGHLETIQSTYKTRAWVAKKMS